MSYGGGGPSGDHGSIGGGGWGGDGQGSGPGTGSRGGGGNQPTEADFRKRTLKTNTYSTKPTEKERKDASGYAAAMGVRNGLLKRDKGFGERFGEWLGFKTTDFRYDPKKQGYDRTTSFDITDSGLIGGLLTLAAPPLGGLYSLQRHVRNGDPISGGLAGLASLSPAGSLLNIASGVNSTADLLADKNVDDLANLSIGDGQAPNGLGKANEDGGSYFTQNRQTKQVAQAEPQQTAAEKKQELVAALMGRPGYTYSGRGIVHTS